ncbi:hypothetical protein V8C35DRAFT_290193 [Trichoderma chlorosporum]
MDSTSQPSPPKPPLETLSIKQLLQLHCRDKLLVHPLEWTSRHLEVLQCSFEEYPPPAPLQEHLDELQKVPSAGMAVISGLGGLLSDCAGRHREGDIKYIIGSDGCPLIHCGESIRFYYDGRYVSKLPCQLFASRFGRQSALRKGVAPIALVCIDCHSLEILRYRQMMPYRGRRRSKATNALYDRHVKRVTPSDRLRDPYLVALLLAVAYNQRRRTSSSKWTKAMFWPQVVMTKSKDEQVHLFAAHVSSDYLDKFDFPSRRPAESAQQPLLIHHIPVPLKPYDTFRHRLLAILLHPGDYYNEG